MSLPQIQDGWFSAAELASLALPGLPGTERGIQLCAARESWPHRPRQGRGGGREYPISALPAKARAALARRDLTPDPEPPPRPPQDPRDFAGWQRAAFEARLALLAEADRLLALGLAASERQAALVLAEAARTDTLRSALAALVPLANQRGGKSGSRTLSARSVQRWFDERRRAGTAALAPKAPPPRRQNAGWEAPFLRLWARPGKRSVAEICRSADLQRLLPAGVAAPSAEAARRLLKSLSPQERALGRIGPRGMLALRAYRMRDTALLSPGDIYTADGKTFRAWVRNPLSGHPFKPEIVTVLDVKTRRAVGWSAGLAESASVVTDALRHAVIGAGIPAIWYTDNGPGFDNETLDDPLVGLLARLGITNMDSLPDRSQSRGIIESFQRQWNAAAKTLPAYLGRDLDKDAARALIKKVRADYRQGGRSEAVMAWDLFLRFIDDTLADYNARPHRGLPRMVDPESGRRRHMSPDEAWAAARADGWEPLMISAEEGADLTRPYAVRRTRRALVDLFGNQYFAPELEEFHGDEVAVGYDIHDAARVWVRQLDRTPDAHRVGRLIAVARWDGHRTDYVPVSVRDQARERRHAAAIKRLDDKRERIEAERTGGQEALQAPAADSPPATAQVVSLSPRETPAIKEASEPTPTFAAPDGPRPRFSDDYSWARWLLANPDRWLPTDTQWMRKLTRRWDFRELAPLNGIDLAGLEDLAERPPAAGAQSQDAQDRRTDTTCDAINS
ncbi:Mu transposase C-terminal domain-containing protein [Roseospirillum parvum]|uniref:Putative transposase n=1 Tax=Roseospirillum parvum TaxID=83401 RepID=A0A1G8G7C9_9PROT|nr:Mu transposase C-terminal domain-containing protein [Roseospirillum parvum]SDH90210.1 putative transposase [Roseospirillum parvum]